MASPPPDFTSCAAIPQPKQGKLRVQDSHLHEMQRLSCQRRPYTALTSSMDLPFAFFCLAVFAVLFPPARPGILHTC